MNVSSLSSAPPILTGTKVTSAPPSPATAPADTFKPSSPQIVAAQRPTLAPSAPARPTGATPLAVASAAMGPLGSAAFAAQAGPTALTPAQQQAVKALQSVDLLNHPFNVGDQGDAIRRFKDGFSILEPGLKQSEGFKGDTYDQATADAVKKYQTAKNLPATGQLDGHTMGVAFHDLFWNHNTALNLVDPAVYKDLPPLHVSVNTGTVQNGGQRISLITDDGSVIKQFPTSTGSTQYPTPKGSFHILSTTERPSWNPPNSPWAKGAKMTPPGPNNPVGNVKMNIVSDIYFHGVPPKEYDSIGKTAASHGCMRMYQSDAWQLHEIIGKGTPVTIR